MHGDLDILLVKVARLLPDDPADRLVEQVRQLELTGADHIACKDALLSTEVNYSTAEREHKQRGVETSRTRFGLVTDDWNRRAGAVWIEMCQSDDGRHLGVAITQDRERALYMV